MASEQVWRVEQACPQCGGPVGLRDTDRLLECAYCRVRLHIAAEGELRYCLPPRRDPDGNLSWVPYWRIRGVAFSCVPFEVMASELDATRLALPLAGLPPSLGVRPAALTLRFATRGLAGRFLAPEAPTFEGLARGVKGMPARDRREVVHRSWLAPLATIVYLPVWHRRLLVDAIVDRRMAGPTEAGRIASYAPDTAGRFGVRFLATLCPHCGWALSGGHESVVLLCRNCHSAWVARHTAFERVTVVTEAAGKSSAVRHLPFWRSSVRVEGLPLGSYGDLARLANLPRVARPGWDTRELAIWTPAFRTSGDQFLRLSRTLTLAGPETVFDPAVPAGPAAAVTLAPEMASGVFVAILADLAVPRQAVFDVIGSLSVTATDHLLVFLPFRDTGRELTRERPPMTVPAHRYS